MTAEIRKALRTIMRNQGVILRELADSRGSHPVANILGRIAKESDTITDELFPVDPETGELLPH